MKRKIYVPVMLSSITVENRKEYLSALREMQTDCLFLSPERDYMFETDTRIRQQAVADLKGHMAYFTSHGLEVGIWIQAFGFGIPLTPSQKERTRGMTKIKSVTGREAGDAFCPENSAYMDMYCEWTKELASLKPAYFMLDDDLCLSVRPGLGCFCERHIRLLEEKTGHVMTNDELQNIFVGKGDAYRQAYLDVMGDTLRRFCRQVRAAVDEVDPDIRVGFCAGFTSWDIEGVDPCELSHILAGNNKPFLRLTGAPYWVAPHWNRFPGQRLHGVIEFAREQEVWCRGEGIEFFSEADSYPRPRYHIPARLLECFDAALTASANIPVLKYFFDYFAPLGYETGYARLHKKNADLYAFLEKYFAEKKAVGIQVYERKRKFADQYLPEGLSENEIMRSAMPAAASMLTELGIPVTYEEGQTCAIAFGNHVRAATTLPARMILDLPAALLLMERGVDTGIVSVENPGKSVNVGAEVFADQRISISHPSGRFYESCVLKENAKILSWFETEGKRIPSAFTYQNGTTEFLVYLFDGYSVNESSGIFCSYGRQKQILDFYSDFPVVRNCPFIYQLCKRNETETVAFFANIFEDEMWDFAIELDRNYRLAECCGIRTEDCGICNEGNVSVMRVHSEVAPYGMFAIRLINDK